MLRCHNILSFALLCLKQDFEIYRSLSHPSFLGVKDIRKSCSPVTKACESILNTAEVLTPCYYISKRTGNVARRHRSRMHNIWPTLWVPVALTESSSWKSWPSDTAEYISEPMLWTNHYFLLQRQIFTANKYALNCIIFRIVTHVLLLGIKMLFSALIT